MKFPINFPDQSYFFDNGLCFSCTGCGRCCTGSSGTIYVSPMEIRDIAIYKNCSISKVINSFLYPFRDSYSIKEKPDGSCLFWEGNCTIYPVRPLQCSTFPFWVKNLRSELAWKETCHECPGCGNGKKYTKEEILTLLQKSPL